MEIVKQPQTLPVEVIGDYKNVTKPIKHSTLFPNHVRCIISGPSNSGKTNLLLNWLLHDSGLKYENIYIYSKSLFQPKYEYLAEVLKKVPEIGFFRYNASESIAPFETIKPNSIFIFDDIMSESQKTISKLFSMGRHKQIDLIYIAQTYAKIPKHLIRDNCNLIVLFRQDGKNLKHVFDNFVNSDMDFVKFQEMCSECWNSDARCLIINAESDLDKGRYRKGLDSYIKWKS